MATQVDDSTGLPDSSVPAAFDRGHLYSPTTALTQYAQDGRYAYDYRPGNSFEPLPEAPRGNPKAFAAWWSNEAKAKTPDFLGLKVGDEITIQHAAGPGPAEVIETWRAGALVTYPYPVPGKTGQMIVRRRNDAGHWYP
ncbi:hypothetical protein ACFWDI_28535 [Streptomyces sp. NPDC060064]|uniref:hypothetical protein n=1 Tax=Streptomyces sp. NPDC060064 TaxID=3347049 RepID=UPI003689A648